LVQVSSAGAAYWWKIPRPGGMPYEPYYKVQASLLDLAINQKPLPPGTYLTLGLFARARKPRWPVGKLGVEILGRDRSPFGPIVGCARRGLDCTGETGRRQILEPVYRANWRMTSPAWPSVFRPHTDGQPIIISA